MDCGKIFKKLEGNDYDFKLVPYDYELSNYTELIKKQKKEGYRQVLFNVEIMLDLIKSVYTCDNIFLQKIVMCTDAGQNSQSKVDDLVLESRSNKSIIYKIVDELRWYSDKESIDVAEILFSNNNYETSNLKSNGIIYGEKISIIFYEFICPQLKRYFNEE